jgi:hypothetical protein
MIVILSEAKDLTKLQYASYRKQFRVNGSNLPKRNLETLSVDAGSLATLGMTECGSETPHELE